MIDQLEKLYLSMRYDYWMGVVVVFFFKQKTAYEVRISDWSSDVCSSDLIYKTQVIPFNHGFDGGRSRFGISRHRSLHARFRTNCKGLGGTTAPQLRIGTIQHAHQRTAG